MKSTPRQQNPTQKMSFDSFMKREDKRILRREILANRKKFYKEQNKEYKAASNKIIDTLTSTEEYKNARVIMVFVSFQDEVFTHNLIKQALKDGKKVCVPYVEKGNPEMIASHLENFNELKEGFYGILAPLKEKVKPVDPKEIDLIVSPGVAFDKEGYRVGYGGGFYDRFLKKVRLDTHIIAIAFNLQMVTEVPRNAHDVPVHSIITEVGLTIFNKKNEQNE